MQSAEIVNTWWHPPEMRRFKLTPHAKFTHTIRNNRTDRCEYYFNSLITRSQHPCFSSNEYLFYCWLDIQPDVRFFVSQPPSITYEMDGKERVYTADTYIDFFDDTKSATEVKDKGHATSEENEARWPYLKKVFEKLGRNFSIVTDEDLKAQPLQHNVEMIRREIDSRPPTDAVYRMTTAFERSPELPFGRLTEYAQASREWARMFVLHLICMRHFTFDFEKTHLNADTPIRLARRGYSSRSASTMFIPDAAWRSNFSTAVERNH